MTWIAALPLAEIAAEDVARFDHAGQSFALYRSEADEVFCTDGYCSHERVHLADGLVSGYEIECPKHASVFDIRSGEVLTPPACDDLRVYPVRVRDGVVEIELG